MLPKECPIGKKPKRKRSSKKDLEGQVKKECLQFLLKCPEVVYVERRNTGAVTFQDGGFLQFGQRGAADIWCLVKVPSYVPKLIDEEKNLYNVETVFLLEHIEIECKRADGKGVQSANQIRFQEFCDSQSIPYILVKSASELARKIREITLDK